MTDTDAATRTGFSIDPVVSRFSVRASAAGMLSALGHNPTIAVRGFRGDVEASEGLADASISIRVDPGQFAVQDNMSDRDQREIERVMKEEVLETDRFPAIFFESTRVSLASGASGPPSAQVAGRLSLHGTTREIEFTAQVVLMGSMLRAFGEFPLRQTDYGIRLVSVAAGGLKVRDEVIVSFDVVARKRG
jgi:polyisoprenoid-binding protein YceI